MADAPPPEGLYRTTTPMPGKAESVPAGRLWLFRHSSEQGDPILLSPETNTNNRWTFNRRGHLCKDAIWLSTLVRLKPEGFYVLEGPVTIEGGRMLGTHQLVQLGYNGNAEPIIFFPKTDQTRGNDLAFPTAGMKITEAVYQRLAPIDLRGPHAPAPERV